MRIYCRKIIMSFCLLFVSTSAFSQIFETSQKVDTLTMLERFSFRTNALDWVLTIPNVGVEYDLGDKNYSRWTIGLNLRTNWQSSHTYNPGEVFNLTGIRLEARNYWRTRKIASDRRADVYAHEGLIDKVIKRSSKNPKHPSWTYYLGGYVGFDKVSLKYNEVGRQGSVLTAGAALGIVKPLYEFANGNSLDIDLGLYAGVGVYNYDGYMLNRESNCYYTVAKGIRRIFPTIQDVNVTFVYRFGKKPITKKYRWRYDCDTEYNEHITAIQDSIGREMMNKENLNLQVAVYDSLYRIAYDKALDSLNELRLKKNLQIEAKRKTAEKLKMMQDSLKTLKETVDSIMKDSVNTDSVAIVTDSIVVAEEPADSIMAAPVAVEDVPANKEEEDQPADDDSTKQQDDANRNEEEKEDSDEA